MTPNTDSTTRGRIALTGATGYVGGRLAPRLLAAGYKVHCLVRSRKKLEPRTWASEPGVTSSECDLLDVDALTESLRGCDAAYYLVHSMQSIGQSYARHDNMLARNFSVAASRAGVKQIIYLGGLHPRPGRI